MTSPRSPSDSPATPSQQSHSRGIYYQLPTLGEFIHNEWRDLLTMFLCMVVALPLNAFPPVAKRRFPITGNAADLSAYAYPSRDQIVIVPVSAVLAIFPPLIIFALAQVRMKSYADLHAATYGLLTTLTMSTLIQCVLKSFVGGLRPYFYDACKPSPSAQPGSGIGYGGLIFDPSICTGNKHEITKAITSFPSGHSTAAAASALFLSLYLNAKLKVFADSRARFWKILVFFFPLLFSATIMGSLTLDQSHNWYDVLAGGFIGINCALAGYRTRYASIWDWRFNHIPLPRNSWLDRVEAPPSHTSAEGDVERGKTNANGTDVDSAMMSEKKGGLFSGSTKPKSTTKSRPKTKYRYIKRSQRFTYDLPSLAHTNPVTTNLATPSNPISSTNETSPTPHDGGPHNRIRWHTPGRASAPHDARYPVLTRRWQGSVVGAPGDAGWTTTTVTPGQMGVEGDLGVAHSPREYGRLESSTDLPHNGHHRTEREKQGADHNKAFDSRVEPVSNKEYVSAREEE